MSLVVRRGTLDCVFGEIRWTEESEAHIARHNVSPREVEEAIYSRPRYTTREDDLRLVFGTTANGRYLFAVVAESLDGRDFIVTARDMTGRERRLFRAKGT